MFFRSTLVLLARSRYGYPVSDTEYVTNSTAELLYFTTLTYCLMDCVGGGSRGVSWVFYYSIWSIRTWEWSKGSSTSRTRRICDRLQLLMNPPTHFCYCSRCSEVLYLFSRRGWLLSYRWQREIDWWIVGWAARCRSLYLGNLAGGGFSWNGYKACQLEYIPQCGILEHLVGPATERTKSINFVTNT